MSDTEIMLDQIDQIISWYDENSSTAPVERLLDAQDKLSTLSWNLAELSSQTKTDYTYKYFIRKIQVNKSAQALVKNQIEKAWNKAISRSEIENEEHLRNEVTSEGAAYAAELKLKQVNKILQVMQQRISFSKKLYEMNQFILKSEM